MQDMTIESKSYKMKLINWNWNNMNLIKKLQDDIDQLELE